MLIRICLIIAVVAGLVVGAVNLVQVKATITTTRAALNTTSNTLAQTQIKLTDTGNALNETKAKLDAITETLRTTEADRDSVRAEAAECRKNAETFTAKLEATVAEWTAKLEKTVTEWTAKLEKTTKERDGAQADLGAWTSLGLPVETIKKTMQDLVDAKEAIEAQKVENNILTTKNKKIQNELDYYVAPNKPVKLPGEIRSQVIVYDPKWDFVVLNVGTDQGVLEHGEFLLNRDSRLVAKVRVFRVDKDRCIANIVDGWKLGEVFEGDSAIPAF
jgi:hypothetical protein